jgi:hypothetical protein
LGDIDMGYDFTLYVEDNHCDKCNRCDSMQLTEMYISYNHAHLFYDFLDKGRGFRSIYGMPIVKLIPKLQKMIETFKIVKDIGKNFEEEEKQMVTTLDNRTVKNDGWSRTNANALYFADKLLGTCIEYATEYPNAVWRGD